VLLCRSVISGGCCGCAVVLPRLKVFGTFDLASVEQGADAAMFASKCDGPSWCIMLANMDGIKIEWAMMVVMQ
jgi:hypothetical protein